MIINYLVSGNIRCCCSGRVGRRRSHKKMKREKRNENARNFSNVRFGSALSGPADTQAWTTANVDVMKLEKFSLFISTHYAVQFSMSNVPSHRLS